MKEVRKKKKKNRLIVEIMNNRDLKVRTLKTWGKLALVLLSILPLVSCYNKENREEILKVYNWADYIDEDVLANFPKCTSNRLARK